MAGQPKQTEVTGLHRMTKKGWTDWMMLAAAAVLFLLALIAPALTAAKEWTHEEQKLWDAYQSGELIRLHVMANSDSPQDQAVKLAVRDAVIETLTPLILQSAPQNSPSLFHLLSKHTGIFQSAAEAKARELGFSGRVTAQAGIFELPAKQ